MIFQQGDPLGPGHLFFCLSIHDLMLQLESEFRAFYLDDGILGGSVSEILHASEHDCDKDYTFAVEPTEV